MQKVVLALDVHDDNKCKQKAMKIAASVAGVDSVSLDTKEKKLTLIGNMDPVEVVSKLRKAYRTEVLTIGPAKEPEKPKENPNEKPKTESENQVQYIDLTKASDPYCYYSHYPRYCLLL